MILRARWVVTMNGAPIEDGAVVVNSRKIEAVGTWREIRREHAGEVLDLGESILLPGLINAHCHLDYTNLRRQIAPHSSFTEWIRRINRAKAAMGEEDYVAAVLAGLDEAARFGTTTIANLEAIPQLIAKAPEEVMRVWWLVEMISVRSPVRAADVLSSVGPHPRVGLAPHAPYTATIDLYRASAALAEKGQLIATTHLAESSEEMEMFRDGRGPLFDFMQSLGRPMNDCGARTPVGLMLDAGVLDERWIVAHMNELTRDDFALLRRAPKFHIVHCPRSHAYFGHAPFAYQKLRELGFNICLGTDSLASNDDLSLFAEMRQFAQTNPRTSACEILEMVTTRAASALQQKHSLGKIAAGFEADLIGIPFAGKATNIFESVVEFDAEVAFRMLYGRVAS